MWVTIIVRCVLFCLHSFQPNIWEIYSFTYSSQTMWKAWTRLPSKVGKVLMNIPCALRRYMESCLLQLTVILENPPTFRHSKAKKWPITNNNNHQKKNLLRSSAGFGPGKCKHLCPELKGCTIQACVTRQPCVCKLSDNASDTGASCEPQSTELGPLHHSLQSASLFLSFCVLHLTKQSCRLARTWHHRQPWGPSLSSA